MEAIKVEHVSKTFKIVERKEDDGLLKNFFNRKYAVKTAVDDISFDIHQGDMVGYLGLNGAGKSTTIKMLSGILNPTEGEIRILGMSPARQRKQCAKKISAVFGQNSQLCWDLPVNDSLVMAKYMYDLSNDEYRESLSFLNKFLELEEILYTPVRQLSLGQRMKANLCFSLLHKPQILFLDEPTIGLDLLIKQQVQNCIKELNREYGMTTILTTHDVSDMETICGRVILIDKGKKIFDNSLKELSNTFGGCAGIALKLGNAEDMAAARRILLEEHFQLDENPEGEILILCRSKEFYSSKAWQNISASLDIDSVYMKNPELKDVLLKLYSVLGGKTQIEK